MAGSRHHAMNSAALEAANPPPASAADGVIAAHATAARDLDGSGITIGVLDWGYDLLHPCLRTADGQRSRLSVLWDQATRVFQAAELDALVAAGDRRLADQLYDPHANYYDRTGARHGAHATLMASIAAGTPYRSFRGIAPGADIVGVHLDLPETAWKEVDERGRPTWRDWQPALQPDWPGWRSYGECRSIVDAIEFVWETAIARGDAALVVNMSLGAWAGAHDGRSPIERRIASLVEASENDRGPVVAVVLCAGNAGADDGHFAARLAPGAAAAEFGWLMAPADPTPNKLEIWYDAAAPIDIVLNAPGSAARFQISPGPTVDLRLGGHRVGIADHVAAASGPLSRARIILHPPYFPAGLPCEASGDLRWSIVCTAGEAQPRGVSLHAWLERDDGLAARSFLTPADPASTLAGLATAPGAVIVAAGDTLSRRGCMQSFPPSSLGPAPWRAGDQPSSLGAVVPHVRAPGHGIWGAKSKSDGFVQTSGSSPAAAITSGALALAFQAAARAATATGTDRRKRCRAIVDRLRNGGKTASEIEAPLYAPVTAPLAASARAPVAGVTLDISELIREAVR